MKYFGTVVYHNAGLMDSLIDRLDIFINFLRLLSSIGEWLTFYLITYTFDMEIIGDVYFLSKGGWSIKYLWIKGRKCQRF